LYTDLRDFIADIDKRGELRHLTGADTHLEIGALTEYASRLPGAPAILFDEVPGFRKGFRLLVNALASPSRVAPVLGMPASYSGIEIVDAWRKRLGSVGAVPPREVSDGPLLENVLKGDDVNLDIFPTPLWHEQDGGRYIGTGCSVLLRDPETGWVNAGTYRVMVLDSRRMIVYISPGKHGRLIREKYFARGESCPVAVVCGQDPAVLLSAFFTAPWGHSEFEFAGWLRGEAVPVLKGPTTGLPLPATAELVIEGQIVPDERSSEGPFGEWTGYYASGTRPEPVTRITAILHRNDPVIHGAPPIKPPSEVNFVNGVVKAAGVWNELDAAGIPGVQGVWQIPAGGVRFLTVVSIKQMYGGHARQAGQAATSGRAGAYLGRFVIVVDEDIDPTDINDVLWAISTRCDPATSIEILRDCWSSPLDPRMSPDQKERGDFTNSRAVLDATRPFPWRDRFPAASVVPREYMRSVLEKWAPKLGF
jgi:UbiD family decarboxylase